MKALLMKLGTCPYQIGNAVAAMRKDVVKMMK
jgi:hypothetical protein